jgi:flagellar basal-body rod protein FlgG
MLRALWTAATGLTAQQRNVDVTANNMANVNTTGFKRQRASFHDLFYARLKEPGTRSGTAGGFIPSGIQVGHGVFNVGTPLIFTPGTPEPTGSSLDLMLMDRVSFFQVVSPGTGETLYTRDGSFKLDANRDIVTVLGYHLADNINVPADATDISVARDGSVSAIYADRVPEVIGQIELATFPNPAGLRLLGSNLYQMNSSSGDADTGDPGTDQFGEVQSGFLESSNVEAAEELINLIKAQRAFEMNSRTIQTADEMLQTTAALRR